MPSKSADTATIEAEIDRIRSLGLDEIRNRWRKTLASPPPAAFSKDLIVRFLCWHLQEQAFGGLDPNIAKVLNSLLRGDKHRPDRRLKPGTVLVREYQGLRHTVTVAPDGYVWREQAYASLSAVARAITGTSWNGHRFFGVGPRHNRPMHAEDGDVERPDGVADRAPSRQRATRNRRPNKGAE